MQRFERHGRAPLVLTTFSITARCPRTGMLGVGVCTAIPAVGAICPFVKPRIGAIASQSFANPYLGIDGLALLEQGHTAQSAVDRLIAADPGRARRQLSVVDGAGNAAAFTGQDCIPWHGDHVGPGYVVAANMMVDATTVEAMVEAFEASRDEALPERLLRALEAGDATGGDYRGRQSAALLVYDTEAYPSHSLRVDEHSQPVPELRRVFAVCQQQLYPWLGTLPTRTNPLGTADSSPVSTLRKTPGQR